jgi:hypothetical protein
MDTAPRVRRHRCASLPGCRGATAHLAPAHGGAGGGRRVRFPARVRAPQTVVMAEFRPLLKQLLGREEDVGPFLKDLVHGRFDLPVHPDP